MKTLLLMLLTLPACAQFSSPAFVASATSAATGGGGGGALTVQNAWKASAAGQTAVVTVTGTAGRMLVVGVVGFAGSSANHVVSDNIDGTTGWTKVASTNGAGSINVSMWYKANIPSGVTRITNNVGASATFPTAIVHEVSGGSQVFTSGESAGFSGSGNASTGTANNATAASIFFAFAANVDGGNPATWTLNGSGTVGTWNLKNSTNSQELDGSANTTCSMPNIIVASSTTEKHVWTSNGVDYGAVIAAFH